MAANLKEQIKAVVDVTLEPVQCPEWSCTIYIKGMSGAQRDAFEASLLTGKGRKRQVNTANIRAKLVVRCACDAEGNPLFTDDDAGWLGLKSSKVLDRLYAKAQELSGVSDDDVEEMVGNSDTGPSAASS